MYEFFSEKSRHVCGRVILEFNRQAVTSIEELQSAMRATNGRPALLLINRDGNNLFITVRLR